MKYVLKTRHFAKWANKADCTDAALLQALHEMEQGLVDADLGGNVYKKRVPLPGQGKRGGSRVVIATNRGDRWFFLYGFAKSDRDNISKEELRVARDVAQTLLALSDDQLDTLIADKLYEVIYA